MLSPGGAPLRSEEAFMHIALVGPDLEENLSLRYLSSSLKAAGHDTTIHPFEKASDLADVRRAVRGADVVGLSMCYQLRAREFLDLADAIKRDDPHRRIVAGGHYASCEAKALLEHHPAIDVIAIHEAERTLVELAALSDFSEVSLSTVKGIVFRGHDGITATPPREILRDLDSLPWADRSGPARLVMGVPTAYMMGSRGCQSACDYCCITTLHRLVPGKRFRQRSTSDIADEMASLYHDRGVRQFVFHDDNFLVASISRNLERIDALDAELKRRGMRELGLVLKCRPGDAHREVFERLKEMGLLRVFLGIESGSEEGLRSLGRHQTVEQADRALTMCEELGISTQYTMITFHPEATTATIKADLDFVRRHLAHPLSFCRAEAYAGTPLEQKLIAGGRANGDYLFRGYDFTDPTTEVVWQHARRALRERFWSCNHLLGRVVQLDHLATVFRHFYRGPQVDALVESFLAWQLEVNQDSIELFSDLVDACERWAPDSPELAAFVRDLQQREETSREAFEERRKALRVALYETSFRMIGLARPAPGRLRRIRVPRLAPHAAAVLLAIGLLHCGGNTETTDRHGVVDASSEGGTDAKSDSPSDVSSDQYTEPDGVFEAPPWDGDFPEDVSADQYDEPDGVYEAPPWDGDFPQDVTNDQYDEPDGVYEAPPWDAGPDDASTDQYVEPDGVYEAPPWDA